MSVFGGNNDFQSSFYTFQPSGWDPKNWMAGDGSGFSKSSTLYKVPSESKKKGGVKRRRDGVDQVDSALKKLRFTTNNEGSSPQLSKCTALAPVTRPGVWNRSHWEAKRTKPRLLDFDSNFGNFSNNFGNNFGNGNLGAINIPSSYLQKQLPKVQSPTPSNTETSTALVLYRPPGHHSQEYDDTEDQDENTPPIRSYPTPNSKTLYSSPGCTIELLDEDEVAMS
jgi:hypothetical protein